MIYSLAFIASGVFTFALLLVLPHLLGPEAFGMFSLVMTGGTFIYTVCFSWLRNSVLRFLATRSNRVSISRRVTFQWLYKVVGISVVLAGGVAMLVLQHWIAPLTMMAGLALVLSQGQLDFRTAVTRALFLKGAFTRLLFLRGFCTLVLCAGIAYFTKNAALCVIGAALANIICVQERLRHPYLVKASQIKPNMVFVRRCIFYGFPLIAGGVSSTLIPFLFRGAISAHQGAAAVGIFSLPFDTVQRIIMFLAMAVNIASFQNLVRAHDRLDRMNFRRKAGEAAAQISILVAPALVGFALIAAPYAEIFVPETMRADFIGLVPLAVLTAGIAITRYFIFDAILMVVHQTMILLAGSALSLAIAVAWMVFYGASLSLGGYGLGLLAAQCGGLALSLFWLWRCRQLPIFGSDLPKILVAAGLMAGAVSLLPDNLFLRVGAGAAVYAAACWWLDPVQIRRRIKDIAAKLL